jgi:hypothetical protein
LNERAAKPQTQRFREKKMKQRIVPVPVLKNELLPKLPDGGALRARSGWQKTDCPYPGCGEASAFEVVLDGGGTQAVVRCCRNSAHAAFAGKIAEISVFPETRLRRETTEGVR